MIRCVGALSVACMSGGRYRPESSIRRTQAPATFRGMLPCADCEAIRYHLISGRMASFTCVRSMRTRWSPMTEAAGAGPDRPVILLYGDRERSLQFEIRGSSDPPARPTRPAIKSSLAYELTSDGAVAATDLSLVLQECSGTWPMQRVSRIAYRRSLSGRHGKRVRQTGTRILEATNPSRARR